MNTRKDIYLAGGCFWGTEHFLGLVPGVIETSVGYANSKVPHPDYREVCTGSTGAAETVHVVYDPARVSLDRLLELYFMTIDPTSVNRQGNDVGTQYRTGIYYTDPSDLPVIERALERLQEQTPGQVEIEVLPLENFYRAEEYHQAYLDKNPGGYCHINPALFDVARQAGVRREHYVRPSDSELRQKLTPLQYAVTQQGATEPPYVNEYNSEFRPGVYVDVTTGEPLFSSDDKFESGCGWPAFSRPISDKLVIERRDLSHGMDRMEVVAANSGAHLGHVFPDGPAATGGLRYCINSAALRFVPADEIDNIGAK